MFKNVAGQKVTVYAVDASTGLGKSGDAANITLYVSKDDGAVTALTDTSATEADATNAKGDYLFDTAQAETNADKLRFTGKSTTANVVIVPQTVYTTPANFSTLAVDGSGKVTAGTVSDKTGYALTQAFPANFADLAITATTGRVTAGTVSDKTGYSVSGTLTTLDALATHGDSAWPTATGFALASVWTSTLAAHLDAVYGKLPTNNIADETLLIAATSAILSAVGSPLQAGSYTAAPTAAAVADKVLGRNLAGGSDGGRTVTDALRFLRNRWTRTADTLTVYAEDDSTTAWSSVLTVSSALSPVSGSDPG